MACRVTEKRAAQLLIRPHDDHSNSNRPTRHDAMDAPPTRRKTWLAVSGQLQHIIDSQARLLILFRAIFRYEKEINYRTKTFIIGYNVNMIHSSLNSEEG